jgi:hypothetical protein
MVVGARTTLVYPKAYEFGGPILHANNMFVTSTPGEGFTLTPTIYRPIYDKPGKTETKGFNFFQNLANQIDRDGKGSPGMRKLAQDGLTYHLKDGQLVPDFSDPVLAADPNVTNWFPPIVRASRAEVKASIKDGKAFQKYADQTFVVQVPKSGGVDKCPKDMTTFLNFPKEAFDALSKIKQFHPDSKTSDDPATIVGDPDVAFNPKAKNKGSPKYYLSVEVNRPLHSLGLTFSRTSKFEPENQLPPLKLTQVGNTDQWVIPYGDPTTKGPMCQYVTIHPADPLVRNSAEPALTGGSPGS